MTPEERLDRAMRNLERAEFLLKLAVAFLAIVILVSLARSVWDGFPS